MGVSISVSIFVSGFIVYCAVFSAFSYFPRKMCSFLRCGKMFWRCGEARVVSLEREDGRRSKSRGGRTICDQDVWEKNKYNLFKNSELTNNNM